MGSYLLQQSKSAIPNILFLLLILLFKFFYNFQALCVSVLVVIFRSTKHLLIFAFVEDSHSIKHIEAVIDPTSQIFFLIRGLSFL